MKIRTELFRIKFEFSYEFQLRSELNWTKIYFINNIGLFMISINQYHLIVHLNLLLHFLTEKWE